MTAAVDFINNLSDDTFYGAALTLMIIGAWVLTAWSAR